MKFSFLFSLFLIVILSFGTNVFAQKTDKQTESVLQLLKKYDDAWNKKDSATVAEIFSDNYVYFTSRGGIRTRQVWLDFLKSPAYSLTFAERSEIETYRTENTITVSSRWKGRGTYEKREFIDDQRCGLVFVKAGKQWKLAAEHCTQIVSN